MLSGILLALSQGVFAHYTPVRGDVINAEVESTFSNILDDDSIKAPIPVIFKVNGVTFMGLDIPYVFKYYHCKLVAMASMPTSSEYEVRNPKVYLRLDNLICQRKMTKRDKYVVNNAMEGWGFKNKIIGVQLNKEGGLDVGDKIDFFVNKEGITTIYYRKHTREWDSQVKNLILKQKENKTVE